MLRFLASRGRQRERNGERDRNRVRGKILQCRYLRKRKNSFLMNVLSTSNTWHFFKINILIISYVFFRYFYVDERKFFFLVLGQKLWMLEVSRRGAPLKKILLRFGIANPLFVV